MWDKAKKQFRKIFFQKIQHADTANNKKQINMEVDKMKQRVKLEKPTTKTQDPANIPETASGSGKFE